ncbi:MAG: hypothetical protein ACK4YP_17480 [Myxococcota bacterium]
MSAPLLAALAGRCPACREGRLHAGFLLLHELCPACGVRFERYVSTRTIATVLAFGVAAALLFGADLVFRRVVVPPWMLMAGGAALGAVLYPFFRNLAVFLLWHNGLVTVDVPEAPLRPPPTPEPFAPVLGAFVAYPREDDPTAAEPRPGDAGDEETSG